ncbi:hypothetical protein AYO39_00235 [Actinobacteria bacterium SCGC AG-212-D09]|nr:hypothetical protein AYO39_00235 [Actinobacteria bacterium SCGC AG-212-D09]
MVDAASASGQITMSSYLLPIADGEPLMWILRERKTAFSAHRRREAERLATGERFLLYTTRGCFHNPTRDRGRVIGVAGVRRPAKDLAEPIRFGEREFPIGVEFAFRALLPRNEGLELAPLVANPPKTFANPGAWSATLRPALVPFDDREAQRLVSKLGDRPATNRVIETFATFSGG